MSFLADVGDKRYLWFSLVQDFCDCVCVFFFSTGQVVTLVLTTNRPLKEMRYGQEAARTENQPRICRRLRQSIRAV